MRHPVCLLNFSNRSIPRSEVLAYLPVEEQGRDVEMFTCFTLEDVKNLMSGDRTFHCYVLAGLVPQNVLAYFNDVPVIPTVFTLMIDSKQIRFAAQPWRGSRNRFTGVWYAGADNVPLPNSRELMSLVVFGFDILKLEDNAVNAIHDLGKRAVTSVHYGPNFVAVENFALGSIISDVIDQGYEIYTATVAGNAVIQEMAAERAIHRRNQGHADVVVEFTWHGFVVGPVLLEGGVRPFDTSSTIRCKPHPRWSEFASQQPQPGQRWAVVFAGTYGEEDRHRYVLPVKQLSTT